MEILIFFFAHHYASLFTQSFYHHRYAAHAMFTMSPFWEKFFFWLSLIFQGSSYLSPTAYGIMHRRHHAFADTEKDPHSPKYDGTLMKMMWKTKNVYNDILEGRLTFEPKYSKGVPVYKLVDKIGDFWPTRILFGLLYIWFYVEFATEWWHWCLLPIHFVMGPTHGAIINWFAHKYGYRNFDLGHDTSTNLLPFDFLMWGESYHNNHHKYGGRANFGGQRWHELDPMWPLIKFMDITRIIRLKKQNPEKAF